MKGKTMKKNNLSIGLRKGIKKSNKLYAQALEKIASVYNKEIREASTELKW